MAAGDLFMPRWQKDYLRTQQNPTTKKGRKRQIESFLRLQTTPGVGKTIRQYYPDDPVVGPLVQQQRALAEQEAAQPTPYTLLPGRTKPRVKRRTLLRGN